MGLVFDEILGLKPVPDLFFGGEARNIWDLKVEAYDSGVPLPATQSCQDLGRES